MGLPKKGKTYSYATNGLHSTFPFDFVSWFLACLSLFNFFLFRLRCYNFGLVHSFHPTCQNFGRNIGTGRHLLLHEVLFFFFFYFELNCRNHPRFSNLGSSTSFLMVHYFLCLMISKIREPFWIFCWMVPVLPCWTVRFGPRLKTLLITTHNSLLICDQIEKIFHGESPLRKYKSPWYGPNFFIVRLEPWETMPLNLINWLFWRNSNLHVWLFNNL